MSNQICAVYARVSTDMQGESLENQVDYAREYIRRLGGEYHVDARYVYQDFDQSGYYTRFIDRPAIKKALQDAEKHRYDVIVFKEISRISRDQAEHIEIVTRFTQNNIRLIAINDNVDTDRPETLDLLGIHSVMSEMESKRISSRVSSGKKSLARRGHWVGEAPIGYRIDGETKSLVIDEALAHIPRTIFKLFTEQGLGTFKIAQYLNEHQMLSKNGNLWSRVTVNRVLRNPAYVGDIVYGKTRNRLNRRFDSEDRYVKKKSRDPVPESDWIVVEGAHPELVDRAVFSLAQDIIHSRSRQNPRRSTHPLTGVLQCGRCGSGMVCQKRVYRGRAYRYYHCSKAFKYGKSMCSQPSIEADAFENVVLKLLVDWLTPCQALGVVVKPRLPQVDEIKREKERIERELMKLRLAYSRLLCETGLSDETFRQLKETYQCRIREWEERKERSDAETGKLESQHVELYLERLNVAFFLTDLYNANMDIEAKRRVFHGLIEQLTVRDYAIGTIKLKYRCADIRKS